MHASYRISCIAGTLFRLCPSIFLIFAAVAVVETPCRPGVDRNYRFGTCDYHVTAAFTVACPRDSALVACFDFDHVRRFLACSSLDMTRISQGTNWRQYLFAYNYVVYRCTLSIKYELKTDSGLVRYSLVQSRINNSFFPAMVELSGLYKAERLPHGDSLRVTYEQNARMSKKLNILYATEI